MTLKKIPNAIFITVRTASTRLPQKCLLPFGNERTIEFLIRKLKTAKLADGIVVCTTTNKEDDVLCEIATKMGVDFFRGSENDKLARWNGAAEKFGVDFIVTGDGDDLFCEPELIDLCFAQQASTKADFIEGVDLICGSFTYGLRASALKKVCEIKDSEDTEMMWVYFKDTGLFKVESLKNPPLEFIKPEIRMTLDYPDDFKFFDTIRAHFEKQGKTSFNLREIVKFLDANPEVIQINQYLQEQFLANQKKKTKLVLKELQ